MDQVLYLYTPPHPPHCTLPLKLVNKKDLGLIIDYIEKNPGCTNPEITEGCSLSFHHQRTRRITDELINVGLVRKEECFEKDKNYRVQKVIRLYSTSELT